MKIIKITNTGVMGRMGKALVQRLSKKKIKTIQSNQYKIRENYKWNYKTKKNLGAFKKTDVIIDFARPKASLQILNYAKKFWR